RKALPAVEVQAGEYEAPQGETEQALAQLWQQLLGVEQVSRHGNFFMLGGHSLLVIRLRQAIRQRWQQDVAVQQLFANPLLTQQACLLSSAVPAQQRICHLLKEGDAEKPVFIVHPVGGDTLCYQQLLQDWSLPNAVFGICHPLVAGRELSVADCDLKKLASLYLQEIRAVQGEGPYHILGWSLGGVIALEIASQLHRDGAEVAYLGLLDSYWPQPGQIIQPLLSDWTPALFTPADWQLFDEEHQLVELCQATGLSLAQQRTVIWSGIDNLSHYQADTASHVSKIQYFSAAGQGGTDNDKAACLSHLRQISGHCQVIELNATHHNIVHQPNTSIINAWIRRAMQQPKELQTGPNTKLVLRSVGEMEIQGEIK
ncbi:thioesterase domain-containing protein, partial [Rheinheimera pacifica]|uniref:thioesterase domain-containing protein n=1 Tax=Rheinheimera pacifica TaxID=173990 RepID=UPI002867A934